MNSLIVIGLLVMLPVCAGISCYVCNGCGDPFDKTAYASSATSGFTVCSKTTASGAATVRAGSSSCTPYSALGYGTFCCDTDLCNGSPGNFKTPILLVFGLIGALFAKYQLV